jgi:hypothetical protein
MTINKKIHPGLTGLTGFQCPDRGLFCRCPPRRIIIRFPIFGKLRCYKTIVKRCSRQSGRGFQRCFQRRFQRPITAARQNNLEIFIAIVLCSLRKSVQQTTRCVGSNKMSSLVAQHKGTMFTNTNIRPFEISSTFTWAGSPNQKHVIILKHQRIRPHRSLPQGCLQKHTRSVLSMLVPFPISCVK